MENYPAAANCFCCLKTCIDKKNSFSQVMEGRGVGIRTFRFGGLLSLLHESPGKLPCTSKEPCKEAPKIWAMITPGENLFFKWKARK